jgi:hypothetical protein
MKKYTQPFTLAVLVTVGVVSIAVLQAMGAGFKGGAGAAPAAPAGPPVVATAVPGAPDFGPNVFILDPATPDLQGKMDAVFKQQERAQFGQGRYAVLLKPGKYQASIKVGFYMQVAGLGLLPGDVEVTGAVRAKADWMGNNATCNFWRSIENLSINPTEDKGNSIWAVSQATAMRRVHVKGNLSLSDGGWSSGGFLADSKIDSRVSSGSQQQWFSRNDAWGGWNGGNWNMVFVGCTPAPQGNWPQRPYTIIEKTPLVREKPFIAIDAQGRYSVFVPDLRTDASGVSWASGQAPGKTVPIEQFYLAHAGKDTAATINAALAGGKHLILTPGIYQLESSILVTRPDTVVMGMGYATLVPTKGTPVITVADVDGVRLSGILCDAGSPNSTVLVQVGDKPSATSHAKNPTSLHDLFCRAGGLANGTCDTMVTINSNNVIGDNFWLWRADHGAGAGWNSNKNATGIIVNGNDVTLYGLFVEHQQQYQTVWNGNGGRVYFYQSELPYDPPSQDAWKHGNVNGYASYKVSDTVKTHEAWGLGVYSVIRGGAVCDNAFEAPEGPGIKMNHLVAVKIAGKINFVINGKNPVNGQRATAN